MSAIHKQDHPHEQTKHTQACTRLRLQPINQRNYSSTKQLTSNGLDLESTKNIHDKSKLIDKFLPIIDKNDHKVNHTYRLKTNNHKERFEFLKKNGSLKLLRKEEDLKPNYKSRGDEIRNIQSLIVTREDKASVEAQSQNSIPLKRGQFLKKTNNYLRIVRRNEQEIQAQKSDVSFEEGLERAHPEEEKTTPAIICSENLLGNGVRKHSYGKMKALVSNPFDRLMRHQEEAKEIQSHQLPSLQAAEFKESQIYEQTEDSCPSATQQQELQELLGMLPL